MTNILITFISKPEFVAFMKLSMDYSLKLYNYKLRNINHDNKYPGRYFKLITSTEKFVEKFN